MNEIKRLYALEWFGPYESIEDIWNDDDTQSCSIYLITGKGLYERGSQHIKYVGITERDPAKRLSDKDHLKKQEKIKYKKYWVGRFSKSSNRNQRAHVELIETLFIRFLFLADVKIINDKKLKSIPRTPVTVLSRWFLKNSYQHRQHKPTLLRDLPDVIMFDGDEYWTSGKLAFSDKESNYC